MRRTRFWKHQNNCSKPFILSRFFDAHFRNAGFPPASNDRTSDFETRPRRTRLIFFLAGPRYFERKYHETLETLCRIFRLGAASLFGRRRRRFQQGLAPAV